MAQQARPKATGQSEERRAQLTMPSTVESMMFCLSDSSRDSAAVSVTLMSGWSVIRWGSRLGILSQAASRLRNVETPRWIRPPVRDRDRSLGRGRDPLVVDRASLQSGFGVEFRHEPLRRHL